MARKKFNFSAHPIYRDVVYNIDNQMGFIGFCKNRGVFLGYDQRRQAKFTELKHLHPNQSIPIFFHPNHVSKRVHKGIFADKDVHHMKLIRVHVSDVDKSRTYGSDILKPESDFAIQTKQIHDYDDTVKALDPYMFKHKYSLILITCGLSSLIDLLFYDPNEKKKIVYIPAESSNGMDMAL